MRSKNLAILITVLIVGAVLVILASYYFEVESDNLIACTEEAMVCPDGSTVVRGGQNCEFPSCPEVLAEDSRKTVYEDFQFALEKAVRTEIGQPIEGYEPQMFMSVFPGLMQKDFDGAEAQIGFYKYEDGELIHNLGDVELIHSAAPALTAEGMATLLNNTIERLGVDPETTTTEQIAEILRHKDRSANDEDDGLVDDNLVSCTMDAKMCPDGSFVGRVGPDCEFKACPSSKWPIRYGEDVSRMEEYRSDCEQRMGVFNECGSACGPDADVCIDVCSMICEKPADEHMPPVPPESTFCTPASRSVDACIEIYQPVCGQVEVQCITTPCNPVPETFSNSCFACMNKNVISYTEDACQQ